MWFRSTLYGAMGVATALAGAFLKFLIPAGLATRIGADSVGNILGILAASMLTVTTFSLSTMVSAYASASNSATPRAARLLIEDSRAQGALATFIGAFLFSIVGLIALSTRDLRIHLLCQIGTFAMPARPLMEVEGVISDETRAHLLEALSCSDARAIDNDPRYGLVILSEIGQRSMSSAINDPGTCIDVIGTCVRLLHRWAEHTTRAADAEVRYPNVHVAPLQASDLFEDVFTPIARDAAGSLEVNIRLQKGFAALLQAPDPAIAGEARRHAQVALARALERLSFAADREALRASAVVPAP